MELLTDRVGAAARDRAPALLIANPAARRARRLQSIALAQFREAGVQCDALLTERPGHAAELAARHASEYRSVFTLGGDGTAMEVIGALANSGRPVGVLPGGTGNLVARAVGVPLSLRRAVPALLHGDEARVDLGRLASGRRFAFSAGVGIDAVMIRDTPWRLKRRFGIWAYLYVATRAALRNQTFTVRALVDGETVVREASSAMVANFGAVLRDLLTLGPGIRQDDGQLDLCIFSPRTFRDALRVAWRLFRHDFRADPCMTYRRGRRFRVDCEPAQTAQADGELIGATPFELEVEPLAARLLVPARTSGRD